jgi:hypothetical protein
VKYIFTPLRGSATEPMVVRAGGTLAEYNSAMQSFIKYSKLFAASYAEQQGKSSDAQAVWTAMFPDGRASFGLCRDKLSSRDDTPGGQFYAWMGSMWAKMFADAAAKDGLLSTVAAGPTYDPTLNTTCVAVEGKYQRKAVSLVDVINAIYSQIGRSAEVMYNNRE